MKVRGILLLTVFLMSLSGAKAHAELVIDGDGLAVKGEAISADGVLMLDDIQQNTIPVDLWIGQVDGVLQSCDGSGGCSSHSNKGAAIYSMAVFNGKLWIGQDDGVLQSCDSLGVCSNHGDKGHNINSMAVFSPASLGPSIRRKARWASGRQLRSSCSRFTRTQAAMPT